MRMMEAVIKGETHLSKKDKQALMEIDLTDFDAVFREGYDKHYYERNITSLYALFAIGHILYGATYGRLYFSSEEIEARANAHGIEYYDEIDTPIYEVYDLVTPWKRYLLLGLSPVLAGILMGLPAALLHWIIQQVAPGLLLYFNIAGGFAVIFLFGLALALAFFMMIAYDVTEKRDADMAENIIEIAEREGYNSILVTCGGQHCSGISSRLEANGWETRIERTDSYVGKILLWIDRISSALMNPRMIVRTITSRL